MRVYLGSTADEVQEFLKELILDVPDVYAPTEIFRSTHPEMDEEELEYSLSLLAAEDALDLADEKSGAPLVIAFEVAEESLGDFDEISAALLAPLHWTQVEAIFTIGESADDLTWFAPQEIADNISSWIA